MLYPWLYEVLAKIYDLESVMYGPRRFVYALHIEIVFLTAAEKKVSLLRIFLRLHWLR